MANKEPTLVLTPGLDGTGLLFNRFVVALPSNIRTHIIDYPRAAASLDEHAAAVAARLPSDRVTLLAESFSGIVALHLLSNREVSVEKIIFVASFGSAPQPYLKAFAFLLPTMLRLIPLIPMAAWRYLCLSAKTPASDIAWVKGAIAQVPPNVLAHRLKLVASAKIRDGERIDVPAYYIQAEGDRLVPHTAAEQLRQVFPHFTLLHVPGPHFLLQSSPTVCAQLIAGIVLDAPAK
jgi:pimeloyl-[acyl-carrier protein] methyl ester esterase